MVLIFLIKNQEKTFLKVKIQALLSESLHTLSSWIVFYQYEFISCLFQALLSENFFSHFEQLNGFSSVWILSCCLQMLWLAELLFTLWAAEWFFIRMNSSMCLQIVWTAELLFTLWAAEWFFIGMNSLMSLQMLWLT